MERAAGTPMNEPASLNVIFSGLVVLEASRNSALVGLLRPAQRADRHGGDNDHHGAHTHPGHRPLLVVRKSQLKHTTATTVPLFELIREEWLRPHSMDAFVGVHLGGKDVVFATNGPGPLTLSPPSTTLRCPHDDFSDLGWLVNFGHKHGTLGLEPRWEADEHVAVAIRIPDCGSVKGTAPLDVNEDGSLHRFVFGSGQRLREQAYTDAFVWATSVTGDVTLTLVDRAGVGEQLVTLAPADGKIDLFVLNHPEDLNADDTPGKHVELVYELPLTPPPADTRPPSPVGKCEGGADATAPAPAPRPPTTPPSTGTSLGRTYCAACLVWNE